MELNQKLFFLFFSFIVLQRVSELIIAKRNERIVLLKGAVEYGRDHYWAIVLLHLGFLSSLLFETWKNQFAFQSYWEIFLGGFILAQCIRYWSIFTLGERWNTRILVSKGDSPINSGPYRYLKHPNYLAVLLEFIFIPVLWNAWWTLLLFFPTNILLLKVRIGVEEKAVYQ